LLVGERVSVFGLGSFFSRVIVPVFKFECMVCRALTDLRGHSFQVCILFAQCTA
jgi:hypothetical protein